MFSPRTPSELADLVKGQTEIGAQHASKPHIGYWLRVEGSVLDVYESGMKNELTVQIRESQGGEIVFLDFKDDVWGARIRPLTIKDSIAAVGKIESIDQSGYITLEECEVLF